MKGMTVVCLTVLAACAAEAPKPPATPALVPIEVPARLSAHCLSVDTFPAPPRLPRTPESLGKWAEATRTAASKALIDCDRRRQDLVALVEGRNAKEQEKLEDLTIPLP